jgi:hypothetical protein
VTPLQADAGWMADGGREGVSRPSGERTAGRVAGWLSGLGLVVVPWLLAGVLSTLGGLAGGESWDPERTFPWWLLAAVLLMLGWLAVGSLRVAGFRRGAAWGAAIAVGGLALVVAPAWLLRG